MSRPLRLEHDGATWHVTSRGNEQRNIFRDDCDREHFLALFATMVKRFHWTVHEYVLMDNHFHLVPEIPQCTLSKGMHWLNSEYARYFNKKYKRCGHLFQGRFKAILIEKDSYLNEVRRYTVLNPVRAGMVADPASYRWSSYRAHAGLEPIPDWLDSRWLFELDSDPDSCHEIYRQFVAEKVGSTDSPWEHLVGQLYLGGETWIARMRKLVESKPRSTEHPRAQRLIPRVKMTQVLRAVANAAEMNEKDLREGHGGVFRNVAAWIGWNEGLLRLREIAAALRLRSPGYVSTLIRAADVELTGDQDLRQLTRDAVAKLSPT